jgi:hypothetical protein
VDVGISIVTPLHVAGPLKTRPRSILLPYALDVRNERCVSRYYAEQEGSSCCCGGAATEWSMLGWTLFALVSWCKIGIREKSVSALGLDIS